MKNMKVSYYTPIKHSSCHVPPFQQLRSVKTVSNVNPKLQTLQAHASLLFGNILASQGNRGMNGTVNVVYRYTPSCERVNAELM